MSLPELPTHRRFLTHLFNSLAAHPSPDPLVPASTHNYPSPLDAVPDAVKKLLLALQVLFPAEFVPALDVLDRQLVTRFRVQDDQEAHHEDADAVMGGEEREVVVVEEEETPIHDDAKLNENENTRNTTMSGTAQDLSITREEATTTTTTTTASTSTDAIPPPAQQTNTLDTTPTVYYVRSAQHHRSSRYTTSNTTTTTTASNTYDPTPNYQVRLTAWHCSCPAFTFAAFPAGSSPDSPPTTSSFVPVDPFHQPQNQEDLDIQNDNDNHNHNDDDNDNDNTWSFGGISLDHPHDMPPPVCKHLLACLLADKCRPLFGDKVHERWVSVREAAGWAAGWGD